VPNPTDDGDQAVRLTEVMLRHAKGSVDADAGAALREVVAAVSDTGKKGSVTVTLDVVPVPKSDGLVHLSMKLTSKVPEHDPATSVWFTDITGNLSRQHPAQPALFPDSPPLG
jgi:lysophospholipid acyltransferase (LPLAT)-like uncharacterized protein